MTIEGINKEIVGEITLNAEGNFEWFYCIDPLDKLYPMDHLYDSYIETINKILQYYPEATAIDPWQDNESIGFILKLY